MRSPNIHTPRCTACALASSVAVTALLIVAVTHGIPRIQFLPAANSGSILSLWGGSAAGPQQACTSTCGGAALAISYSDWRKGSSVATSTQSGGTLPVAGVAAYSLVVVGAYRKGPTAWEILVLAGGLAATAQASSYACRWYPAANSSSSSSLDLTHAPAGTLVDEQNFVHVQAAGAEKPGFGYRLTYAPVVVTCEFPGPVGSDSRGGDLVLLLHQGHLSSQVVARRDHGDSNSRRASASNASGAADGRSGNGDGSEQGGSDAEQELQVLAGTERPGVYNASRGD